MFLKDIPKILLEFVHSQVLKNPILCVIDFGENGVWKLIGLR